MKSGNSAIVLAASLALMLLVCGCNAPMGSPGSIDAPAPAAPPAPAINISPATLGLRQGASATFTASVPVTWSIREGAAGGTISDAGLYTAPGADGTYHVIATDKTNPANHGTAIISVSAHLFSMSGSLAVNRYYHTATLLQSGQVFIAGGVTAFSGPNTAIIGQAEQFDPAAATFHAAGTVARYCHSATLLANGDVLIAGGTETFASNGPVPLASAWIIKAGSGTIQPTGSMSVPRCGHQATLLQDGRVLITGGWGRGEDTQTTEAYDPVAGTFAPLGKLHELFVSVVTLLSDGRVLIIGGTAGPIGSAEIFDPETNAFTVTTLSLSRFYFTATLLSNGKILIVGGEVGSYDDQPYSGPAQIYDPVTGTLTPTGSMIQARWGHDAILLHDGTVLITGGLYDANYTPLASAEIYDPTTGEFKPGPAMNLARVGHTTTLLPDGSVLIVGGSGDGAAEIYK